MMWSLSQPWNVWLNSEKTREIKARNYIYASEIGKAPIDVYLAMKGVKPSNPPDIRSRRKFKAGEFFEKYILRVMLAMGVLRAYQEYLEFQYDGLLSVHGRLDFIGGGKPKELTEETARPIFIFDEDVKDAIDISRHFVRVFKSYLPPKIIEVKTKSQLVYNQIEATNQGDIHHALQIYHYLKSKNLPEGEVLYICRDDLRLTSMGITYPKESLEKQYREYIEAITYYYTHNERPPREKEIEFDFSTGKFVANWKVGYSNYLTMIYGYKHSEEFREKYQKLTTRWNRVITRLMNDANITLKNHEVINEIKQAGFNLDDIINQLKSSGIVPTLDEEQTDI